MSQTHICEGQKQDSGSVASPNMQSELLSTIWQQCLRVRDTNRGLITTRVMFMSDFEEFYNIAILQAHIRADKISEFVKIYTASH